MGMFFDCINLLYLFIRVVSSLLLSASLAGSFNLNQIISPSVLQLDFFFIWVTGSRSNLLFLTFYLVFVFLRQCEGSTLSLESAAGFERMPCRSVSQEALNEPVKNLHVRKQTPGKPVQRAQSQGDSVISGGSLQDRDSDFERSPLGRTRPPVVKTKYSRKFSDPQPLGLFPGHVSLTVYSSISAFTF